MSLVLEGARIEAVVQAVADRLSGDWLLVGGGLVALWLEPRRTTEDVDVVGIPGTGADRFELLGLAGDLGLPVEALNSAADFFVQRIPDWRDHVEPFRAGARGRVFRPSPTLFLLLKLRRLSDRDLADCQLLLRHASTQALAIDVARVLSALDALPEGTGEARERRDQLRNGLMEFATPT